MVSGGSDKNHHHHHHFTRKGESERPNGAVPTAASALPTESFAESLEYAPTAASDNHQENEIESGSCSNCGDSEGAEGDGEGEGESDEKLRRGHTGKLHEIGRHFRSSTESLLSRSVSPPAEENVREKEKRKHNVIVRLFTSERHKEKEKVKERGEAEVPITVSPHDGIVSAVPKKSGIQLLRFDSEQCFFQPLRDSEITSKKTTHKAV